MKKKQSIKARVKARVLKRLHGLSTEIESAIRKVIVGKLKKLSVVDVLKEIYPYNVFTINDQQVFGMDMRDKFFPEFDFIVSTLSGLLDVSCADIERVLYRHADEVIDIYYHVVGKVVKLISDELGYSVCLYGKKDAYWGVPVGVIGIGVKVPRRLISGIRRWFVIDEVDRIAAHVQRKGRGAYLRSSLFKRYVLRLVSRYVAAQVRKEVINVFDFVEFKDQLPARFLQKVWDTVEHWNKEGLWAVTYRDYVKKWLETEQSSSPAWQRG